MQKESNILPLFCTPTRPSYHESENQELFLWGKLELHNIDSVHASCQTVVYHKFGNPGSYCNCCWCCFLLVCFSLFALFSTGNLSQDRCQGNRERPCQEQRRSKRHPISGTKSCNKSELKLRRRQERQKSAYLTLKEGVLHALHLHFSFAVHSAVLISGHTHQNKLAAGYDESTRDLAVRRHWETILIILYTILHFNVLFRTLAENRSPVTSTHMKSSFIRLIA